MKFFKWLKNRAFFRFLVSKTFFINLLIAIVLVVIMAFGTINWLDSYSDHGEAVTVPDFTGLNIQEARELAEKHELEVVVSDSVYVDVVERGSVYTQKPKPDFQVKRNRVIYLTLNAFMPEMVEMPDLVGLPLKEASALLETYGLKTGKKKYIPHPAKDNVRKQLIKGKPIKKGVKVEKGTYVDLELGKGQSFEKISVPRVLGLTYEEAESLVGKKSLNLVIVGVDEGIRNFEDTMAAWIYQQRPYFTKDAEISVGDYIDVYITLDKTKVPGIDTTSVDND
ncbi:MAG: PASTA domain-containing protein [Bacteroidales bacterium]|nr:PASTA domain-containing protein [Bacteroidales bacterium]